MAVTTDRMWSPWKLSVVFAFSAVLLLASLIRFVWVDYDRPWRKYQADYWDLRTAIAHHDSVHARNAVGNKASEPEAQARDLHPTTIPNPQSPNKSAIRNPQSAIGGCRDALTAVRNAADNKKLPDSPIGRTLSNVPLLDFLTPRGTPGKIDLRQLVLPDVRQPLYYVEPPTTDRCVTCHVAIDDPDFAPQTLSDKLNIQPAQPLLAHSDLDLYVHPDSPHPMSRMGCTVCHEGNGRETDFVLAAHTPANQEQKAEWKAGYYQKICGLPTATFESVDHSWDRPMLPLPQIESACVKCHSQITDLAGFRERSVARKINAGRHLFITNGCANCHAVEGLTDAPKVGPDLSHVAAKISRDFAERWIFNPRQFQPSTRMPHAFLQENNGPGSQNDLDPDPVSRTQAEVAAIAHYLFQVSSPIDKMERPPQNLTGDPLRGRELFRQIGCLGCHSNIAEFGRDWIVHDLEHRLHKTFQQARADVEAMSLNDRITYALRNFATDAEAVFHPETAAFDPESRYNRPILTRTGPELSAVASKTSKDWIYAWIRNPAALSPRPRMPDLRLTQQEAVDLAEYLGTLKGDRSATIPSTTNTPHQETINLDDAHRMDLGKRMIAHYGCCACHTIPGFDNAARPGPELTEWAEKPLARLDFGYFDPAFDDLRAARKDEFARLFPSGREDLVSLAGGSNPENQITRTRAAFARHKLRNPRLWDRQKAKEPYLKLKMPNLYLTDAQTDELVTCLLAHKPPRVTANLLAGTTESPQQAVAAGRDLVRELACTGCHTIEDNAAAIHQCYRTTEAGRERFDESNAPPALHGQGARTQPVWLHNFFRNVETLRPWLNVRMPSYQLTSAQAALLTEYSAGIAQRESQSLTEYLRPFRDHVAATQPADPATTSPATGPALNPEQDWTPRPPFEKTAAILGSYAIRNRLMRPFELDRHETTPKELSEGYAMVLRYAEFFEKLFDVPYPFTETPTAPVSDARYETGRSLLLELKCLRCHTLGDPAALGTNPQPLAPNLIRLPRRLRHDWARNWLQAPSIVKPGTKMPTHWPGWPDVQSAFVDYGPKRATLQATFGATALEQIALLLDFLRTAGLRNDTVVQPPSPAQSP